MTDSKLPQQEEQYIFDLGVNLKFGDSLQIYNSFYNLYTKILNDVQIDYILKYDDLMKGFFNILENCNFLEFGVLCYKILEKMLDLVEKWLFLNLNKPSSLIYKSENPNLTLSIDLSHIQSFLSYSLESLTKAIGNDISKLSFYIPLLNKNYIFYNRVIMSHSNYYELLYSVLYNFNKVVLIYKEKNLNVENYFIFVLNLYANMTDEMLLDFLETNEFEYEIEPLQFIKDIFFTICSNAITNKTLNDICSTLLSKFESIKDDSKQVKNFLIDYNNATLINKSLEITKQMLNGQSELNIIIDNFYNILLSLKFLNNNTEENDYNSLFPNDSSPLIKNICEYYLLNSNENYNKCIDLITKLLVFKSSEKTDSTLSIYKSIYDELKVKGKRIFPIFLNPQVLNLMFLDLTNDIFQDVILEIIFILFNETGINENPMKKFFMLLPPFLKNFKFSSLQAKYESAFSYEEIMTKYLRYLFSKNENIRFNAINFYNYQDKSNIELTDDDSNLKKNYDEFKSIDTALLIQTAENEMLKIMKIFKDDNSAILGDINEFIPLLNIIVSEKMDYNLKTSALNQLIFMFKNPNYRNYFLNDILNYILKEIIDSGENFRQASTSGYYLSLIKVLDCIIFFYLNDEKIQNLLLNGNKELINKMLTIALQKDSSKHLMSSFALLFIYMYVFYYKEENFMYDDSINESFPVLRFFDKYYYINLLPVKLIDNIYNEEGEMAIKNSILNFSITKNIIDYIHYVKYPLIPCFKYDNIVDYILNMKNSKDLKMLDIYVAITQLFSYYSIYYSQNFDISECLVHIMFFFKKVLPTNTQYKNLIMDFLNILDLFIHSNSEGEFDILQIYKLNLFPFIPEFISGQLNYISINKDFIKNLGKDIDNQNLVFELLHFMNRNQSFFPFKLNINTSTGILSKFLETYSNIFIFNQENSFYNIKLALIKFESNFLPLLLRLNLSDKTYSDQINTITFFLTKYEPNASFINFDYMVWILNFVIKMIKADKCRKIIQSKSFIFVKLLQSPYIEINVLAINILSLLLSQELFEKHGTILTDIFNTALNSNNKILRTNYFNFVIKSIEFILSRKSLDDNEKNELINEVLAMNEKIYEEGKIVELLSGILNKKEYDSMYCAMILKYLTTCFNIDLENIEYIKGIFFNFNFYDFSNDVINREREIIQLVLNIDLSRDPVLRNKINNNEIEYTNTNLKNQVCLKTCLESIMNVKEILNLFIKSFTLLNEDIFKQYKSILNEIFLNLISYNELIVHCWERWSNENNNIHIKVLQSYVLKYFSYLRYIFDLPYEIDALTLKPQNLNNICYDFMKFDNQSNEYNEDIKLMFSQILPFLVELNEKMKSSTIEEMKSKIKNDGDILLEIMTTFKKVYEIKVEVFDSKVKCTFKIENKNLKIKNDLMNSISSILLDSQSCKRIFVKSKFINTFTDYIDQIREILLNEIVNKKTSNPKELMISNRNTIIINYVLGEFENVLRLMQNLLYNFKPCNERDELFRGQGEVGKFLEMLFNIFFDVIRYNNLFENYLKLLLNILSNDNGELSKFFLTNVNQNSKGDNLLNLVLDYFNKNINVLTSNPNYELYIKFMKCLLQYKPIALSLLKTRFDEGLKKNIIKLVQNKNTYKPKYEKNLNLIGQLTELAISLSLDVEHSKKLGTKDFLIGLSETLLKTKKEDIIYNIIFLYRNVCFTPTIKTVFMSNQDLLGTVFALFTSQNISIKLRYILSNLMFVLLYNNQTLKTLFSKEEFKNEIKLLNMHLQKDLDMKKFMKDENSKENEEKISEEDKQERYLENTCLTLKKIMHILAS